MDPEIDKAFRKAIKGYFEDFDFEQTHKSKPRKYNKKYFDGVEKEVTGEKVEEDDADTAI